MNRHERMMERIREHGENLKVVFGLSADTDPVKLCKALRRIEAKAHMYAEDVCSARLDVTDDDVDQAGEAFLSSVDKLLHFRAAGIPVVVNGDPRGYALKIDDAWMRERPDCRVMRDWGGYGILAPDLTED